MLTVERATRDAVDRRKSLQDELQIAYSDEEAPEESEEGADGGEIWEDPSAQHQEPDEQDGCENSEEDGSSEEADLGGLGSGSNDDDLEDEESEEESSFLDDDEVMDDESSLESQSQADAGDDAEIVQSRDKILDWWCQRQLARTLRRLAKLPKAGPFKEPLPWRELGLDDYPEVIEDPIDLRTIGERLERGEYKADDGLLNPEFFWQDVAACWENCKIYYEDDVDIEAVRIAEEMRVEAEQMEHDFWDDLEQFEQSLDRVGGPTLSKVAAVADVAVGAMEDAASAAYQESALLMQRAADWWNNLRGRGGKVDEQKQVDVLKLEAKPRLRDHFVEILQLRFRVEGREDILGIEEEVTSGMSRNWPSIPEESDLVDYVHDVQSDIAKRKLPIERLLPTKYLAHIFGPRAKRKSSARCSSVASSRSSLRSSRFSLGPNGLSNRSRSGSRRNSVQGSVRGDSSPARSETSARQEPNSRSHTPRSHRSEGSSGVSATLSRSGSRMMSRAVRSSCLASGAGRVPGVESSSESDPDNPSEKSSVPVEELRDMMPQRGSTRSWASSRASTPGVS
eukprot:gb/GFBE01019029.1/.p1 GENE.gb/GFBE01019029.1/~~gb/GFBE01019029.1/.p1  ORF type:complete len:567 (+),score=104.29 gb/GFBE01019029.1/:1-1701(+)